MVVIDYKGLKAVNQHGEVNIVGSIPIEMQQEYFYLVQTQKLIKITATEVSGESQILLYGRLTDCDIAVEGHTATMKIQVKTGTCLMEQDRHTRTFQDKDITYKKILNICNESYANNDVILANGKGKNIPEFIVQYQEHDWEFIKRLASYENTVIVPDTMTGGVKYYFGLPNFTKKVIPQNTHYKICKNLEEYEYKKANGIRLSEEDCIYYEVATREIYEIGNRAEFLEKEFFIYRIESEMRGSELYHVNYLKSSQGLQEARQYNQKMRGAGLKATVKSVKEDKVQVSIKEDENKGKAGYRWFAFSTVYSSPDGSGWYCMPEPGDTVRLCFPSEKAPDAYVSSAVHEYSDERTNPELKFLKNRHGKEICLSPDRILLTNNDGTYIEISDKKGIRMKSSGSISMHAANQIAITSQTDDIQLNAKSAIRLKQRNSAINIKDDITFEGMQVKLH